MGKMIDGKWSTEWYASDETGHFIREDTVFAGEIRQDGSTKFQPEAGRYHLYISLACPWASRVLMARSLLGLKEAISVSVVHWLMGEEGWAFRPDEDPDATDDPIFGADLMQEIYLKADPRYTGRVTVPALWDKKTETIVNNESRDLLRMLSTEFKALASTDIELSPPDLRAQIDETIDAIYEPVNNGVYRAGFAYTQEAYDEAIDGLFSALDRWEAVLAEQRYLCGARFTEADICLFTTLVRFDPVYATHFKCNRRRLLEYPNLWNYMLDIYQMPGVAETVNLRHIKNHYYQSHPSVNPKRIVARGFDVDYDAPHDRARFEQS